MMKAKIAAAAAIALFATGCATHQQTGTLIGAIAGTAIGGPIGGTAAAHIGAGIAGGVIGGAVGSSVGKRMDEKNRKTVVVEKATTVTYVAPAPVVQVTPVVIEPAPTKVVKKIRE